MKKLKRVFLLLLSCLFASTIALAACSNKDSGDGYASGTTLISISVDASSAKTSYNIGEEFTSDGLVVTATTTYNSEESTKNISGYTVDFSEFDNTKTGDYTIYISYSISVNPNSVQYAEYNVTVASQLPTYANISAEYSGDRQYTLTADAYSGSGVTIDLSASKFTVKSYIGEDSTNLTEAAVTDYSLEYSYNSGARTAVENSAITTKAVGTYSVYVISTYTSGTESFTMEAQVVFYVVDTISSITYNSDGATSFVYGARNLGSEWTYTLTYASGITKTASYDDVKITASNLTSGTATVSYTDTYIGLNSSNSPESFSNTVSTTVSYTVAAATLGETTYGFTYSTLSDDDVSNFSVTKYYAENAVENNDMFTLVSNVDTETSLGKNSGKISLDKKVSFSDIDGNTVSSDYGLKLSTAMQGNGSDSGYIYTLTAKKACTVKLYLTYSDNSHGSNRIGYIYYCVNDEEAVSTYVASRETVVTVEVVLYEGETLNIGAICANDSTSKLWLFGAQAKEVVSA